MKAEERHELKTNELAQWILGLPQEIKENLQTIIYVSAAAVLILAAILYYAYQKNITAVKNQASVTKLINTLAQSKPQILQAQAQGVDLSYNLIQTADELESASQDIKNNEAAALALIKRAEALRMELHYRPGMPSSETLVGQITTAKAAYEKALEKTQDAPALTAKAKYGLGLCEEELGNSAAAAKIYSDIVNDKSLEGTVGQAEAKYRLEIMTDYEKPVTFLTPPKPIAEPVVQPATEATAPAITPATTQVQPADAPNAVQK